MNNKTKMRKLQTQYSLQWSLKIGDHLGTLDSQKAIKLANVKPAIFQRWISGKLAAPNNKLERIKHCAFDTVRKRHRKIPNLKLENELDEEIIKARLLWKSMIFDQLNTVAKRRFCTGLKKLHR
jgi:hypothetical protein